MKDIKLIDKGRLRVSLAWYDIWIGIFVDTIKKKVYVCPLPGLLLTLRYGVLNFTENENGGKKDGQMAASR